MTTVEVDRELLEDAEAIVDSELEDMKQIDPELEGEWSQRVKRVSDGLDGVLR